MYKQLPCKRKNLFHIWQINPLLMSGINTTKSIARSMDKEAEEEDRLLAAHNGNVNTNELPHYTTQKSKFEAVGEEESERKMQERDDGAFLHPSGKVVSTKGVGQSKHDRGGSKKRRKDREAKKLHFRNLPRMEQQEIIQERYRGEVQRVQTIIDSILFLDSILAAASLNNLDRGERSFMLGALAFALFLLALAGLICAKVRCADLCFTISYLSVVQAYRIDPALEPTKRGERRHYISPRYLPPSEYFLKLHDESADIPELLRWAVLPLTFFGMPGTCAGFGCLLAQVAVISMETLDYGSREHIFVVVVVAVVAVLCFLLMLSGVRRTLFYSVKRGHCNSLSCACVCCL